MAISDNEQEKIVASIEALSEWWKSLPVDVRLEIKALDKADETKARYKTGRDRLYAIISDWDAKVAGVRVKIIKALQYLIEWEESLPDDMRLEIQAEDEKECCGEPDETSMLSLMVDYDSDIWKELEEEAGPVIEGWKPAGAIKREGGQ